MKLLEYDLCIFLELLTTDFDIFNPKNKQKLIDLFLEDDLFVEITYLKKINNENLLHIYVYFTDEVLSIAESDYYRFRNDIYCSMSKNSKKF